MKIEWLKIYRSNYLFILPICLLAIVLFSFVPYNKMVQSNSEDQLSMARFEVDDFTEVVADMKRKDFPADFIATLTEQLQLKKQKLTAIEQNDTPAWLEAEYQTTKIDLELLQQGKISGLGFDYLNLKLAEFDFFRKNPEIEYIPELFFSKLPTSYYLTRLFSFTPIITLLLLLTVILAFYLTMEYRDKTNAFLATFPQKMTHTALKKITTTMLWVLASWSILAGILTLLTAPQYGIGSWKFPFFYLNYQKEVLSITTGEYVLRLGLSLVVLTFFLVTVIYLISALTKSTIATLALSLAFILPAMMPQVLEVIPVKLLAYLPFGYLDLPSLLFYKSEFGDFQPTWLQAIIYLVSFAGLCLFILVGKLQYDTRKTIFASNQKNNKLPYN
ncbi:hypothetical protein [Enterococcus sp.]|uniref:hypothetical protein n=1 Tax=Enterococcus sp. TaxID=35783 RepID=UPI002FCA73F4